MTIKKENVKPITGITIGTDPEMFLFSEEKDKFVPVCGLVGGTKKEPLAITKHGHSLQEDNVAVEFTIPPSKTRQEFVDHIVYVKNHINETILAPKGLISKCVASAIFDEEDLQSDQAKEFGCEADYNAYTLEANRVGRENPLMRTAGFHIHVGYDKSNPHKSLDLIKAMDLFLGVPSVLLDNDTERRRMYGKAGAYRIKPYGVEYRVLSSFFISNEALMGWVFDATQRSIDFVNNGGIITNDYDIIDAINNSNVDKATEILEDYNIDIEILEDLKQLI